jgi:hypothetical protein
MVRSKLTHINPAAYYCLGVEDVAPVLQEMQQSRSVRSDLGKWLENTEK